MLRFLMVMMFVLPGIVIAEVPKYQEPDASSLENQKSAITGAMEEADNIMADGTLDALLKQERGKLQGIPINVPGLNIQMPKYLDKERDDRYLQQALEAGSNIENSNMAAGEAKYPIVLVSFSMPESQIKDLIFESYRIGAAIAVRGLIDDDFETTIVKLKELAGEMQGGVMIDPTLFRRFDVDLVPAFILPLEPLGQCTKEGCPTPRHVKATGSATLQYFLDLVERTGNNNEKAEAQAWLSKYGD